MAAAQALTPPPRRSLSEWAEQERGVPGEASANAGNWSNALFPFLTEIMDCLDPRHASETVTFCKSAQVGGTEIIINWLFAIADMWPGPTLAVQPTLHAASSWVREKISPSILATKAARRVFIEQKSRDGASTTLHKSFRGGFLVLTGANSSVDISSKSIRFVAKDEWDRWPDDVDGQGDPDGLVNARQISYHESGQAKTLQVSTPTVLGVSRIWPAFLAGDQRRFHVACPHCHEKQVLRFKSKHADGRGGLKFDSKAKTPELAGATAVYICEHNGCVIEHWRKREMLATGEWRSGLSEEDRKGRQPSFHINALYSPVTNWAKMVEAFMRAKDDPSKLKTFTNLWLGEPWEERGDAPEIERLMARRGDYLKGVIPSGGLLIFTAADVQGDGIWWKAESVGRDRITHCFDYGFLPGDTSSADNQVWKDLAALWDRGWPDRHGTLRRADAEGIDTGYNTNACYTFARGRPRCKALKGEDGWHRPALGSPTKQDITERGKKSRFGVMLWPVGTWSLKSELYSILALKGVKEGAPIDPPGYRHYAEFHDENYFKQITAETLTFKDKKGKPLLKNGRPAPVWIAQGPNHLHDCTIYCMALEDHYGVRNITSDEWAVIAQDRDKPKPGAQVSMDALWNGQLPAKPAEPEKKPSAAERLAKLNT